MSKSSSTPTWASINVKSKLLSAYQHHQHCQHRKGQPCNVQGPHLDTGWWLTGGNLILPQWTQSQRITHKFPHCTCACVYTSTPRLSCLTMWTCWHPLMASASQTSKPGNPAPHLYLFCQDATGSRRLHRRYPPADYCKSQVFEILPTTGLCSSKWGNGWPARGASISLSVNAASNLGISDNLSTLPARENALQEIWVTL